MNEKVLIIGSEFRNYNTVIEDAFAAIGCITKVYTSKMMGIGRMHIITRLKRKLGFDTSYYYKRLRDENSRRIINLFDEFTPDVVFVRLGNMLTRETTEYISKKSKLVLYLTDPIEKVPEITELLKYYDVVYTYEVTDIPKVKEHTSAPIKTMFGLFNEKVFHPINIEKTIDVYFVGAMYLFRAELLINLIKDFPNLSFRIDGELSMFPESEKLISGSEKRVKQCFSGRNISDVEANEMYCRSRICLNLQHPQTKDGWNSRLTEILGAGTFQIVTANPSVCNEFGDVVMTYSDYESLKCAIEYYYDNTAECILKASKGHTLALEKYTYAKAFEHMLAFVSSL